MGMIVALAPVLLFGLAIWPGGFGDLALDDAWSRGWLLGACSIASAGVALAYPGAASLSLAGRSSLLLVTMFLLLGFAQLAPLPEEVRQVLRPARPGPPGFAPFSLSPGASLVALLELMPAVATLALVLKAYGWLGRLPLFWAIPVIATALGLSVGLSAAWPRVAGSADAIGAFLLLSLPFTVAMAGRRQHRKRPPLSVLFAVAGVAMVWGVIASGSRPAIFLAGPVVASCLLVYRRSEWTPAEISAMAACGVVLGAVLWISTAPAGALDWERPLAFLSFLDPTPPPQVIAAITAHLPAGAGLGAGDGALQLAASSAGGAGYSAYLDMLLELGAFAPGFAAVILAGAVILIMRIWTGPDSDEAGFKRAATIGLAAFLIMGMLGDPRGAAPQTLAAICAAVMVRPVRGGRPVRTSGPIRHRHVSI